MQRVAVRSSRDCKVSGCSGSESSGEVSVIIVYDIVYYSICVLYKLPHFYNFKFSSSLSGRICSHNL